MFSDHPRLTRYFRESRSWVLCSIANGSVLSLCCLAFALAALVLFGVVGVGRPGGSAGMDMFVLWAAGAAWWHGLNPYDPVQLASAAMAEAEPGAFAYPPHIAPLCLALGALPFTVARWLSTAVNVGCAFGVAEFSGRLMQSKSRELNSPWLLSIVLGIPFTSHTVFMGQTPLFALAASLAAVWCAQQKYPVRAGLLLAAGSVKPQIALLIVVWFLFRREFKALMAMAAAVLAALAVPMAVTGPLEVVTDWLHGVQHYQSVGFNQLGFRHMFGVKSFLFALGVHLPAVELIVFLGFGLLWRKRNWLSDLDMAGALLVVAMLGLPTHDYDLVALIPLVFAYAQLTQAEPRMRWVGLALLSLLFFPQRFLRPFDSRVLEQFRVPVVLVGLGLWAYLKARAVNSLSSDLAVKQGPAGLPPSSS